MTRSFTREELIEAAAEIERRRVCDSATLSKHDNQLVKCKLAHGHVARHVQHKGADPVTGELVRWDWDL